MRFGFKRTVPHVLGAAAGIGTLILAVAAGLGTLLETFPAAQLGLKVVGSVYLLYLALRLASSRSIDRAATSKPLNAWEAAAFQYVNPKGWVFAVAVVAAFMPPTLPSLVGGLLLAGILTVVVAGTFSTWALGGAALSKLVAGQRGARAMNLILAVLMVASVALLWI